MSATLTSAINPVHFDQRTVIDLKNQFDTATPYRHLLIDNFLTKGFAETLHANFPSLDQLSKHYHGLNEFKSEGSGFEKYHSSFSTLRDQLNSPEFRKVLEQITGIEGLYSTDDSMGSGVHQGQNGSYLDIHIDFNIHVEKNIHRRLNLLIFLNKDWKEEYGGKLELWNADVTQCGKAYMPSFNRCVIFETSEISYHGYSRITVPPGVTRKSFFTYYYTDVREGAAKYHDTIFKARPEEGTLKKIKTDVKETLKNNIKGLLRRVGIKF